MPLKTLGPIGPRAVGERVKVTQAFIGYCVWVLAAWFGRYTFILLCLFLFLAPIPVARGVLRSNWPQGYKVSSVRSDDEDPGFKDLSKARQVLCWDGQERVKGLKYKCTFMHWHTDGTKKRWNKWFLIKICILQNDEPDRYPAWSGPFCEDHLKPWLQCLHHCVITYSYNTIIISYHMHLIFTFCLFISAVSNF